MTVRLQREEGQESFPRRRQQFDISNTPSVMIRTPDRFGRHLAQKAEAFTDLPGNEPRHNKRSDLEGT